MHFAATDREVHPIQRAYAAEIFGEIGDTQDRRGIAAFVLNVCRFGYPLHGLRAPAAADGATITRFISSAPALGVQS
jgi:hypothetical protein